MAGRGGFVTGSLLARSPGMSLQIRGRWTISMNLEVSTETSVIVIVVACLAIISVLIAGLAMLSARAQTPRDLGLAGNRFVACPATPNCVSTHSTIPQHASEPIRFSGSAIEAFARLQTIVKQQPRAQIISVANRYLHAVAACRNHCSQNHSLLPTESSPSFG